MFVGEKRLLGNDQKSERSVVSNGGQTVVVVRLVVVSLAVLVDWTMASQI